MLVVRSKIKEHVNDMNVSGDFAEALDKEVQSIVNRAKERAKANKRNTVQSRDL